jgi:hypothetical protein
MKEFRRWSAVSLGEVIQDTQYGTALTTNDGGRGPRNQS